MKFEPLVLGDSLESLIDNRGKNPPYVNSGVPVVSGMSVRPGGLDLSESKAASVATWKQWMPNPTRRNDVIMTSEAPLGRVALVRADEPLLIAQRVFGMRARAGVLDSRFLYYALQTTSVQADLASRATGSTVLGIRQPELRKVVIPAPQFAEQRSIAALLGALDDKIAANKRIVSASGELADLLFTHAQRTAAGPDATYEDLATIGGGGTPKTSLEEYWGGEIHWATPTDVTSLDGPYLGDTSRKITPEGLSNISSDLYPEGSILMTSRATIGAFAIAEVPTAINQGFIVVNAKDHRLQWWLFHDMRSRVAEFLSYSNGATFLELSRGKFKKLTVRTPTPEQASTFDDVADKVHRIAANAQKESRKLACTRDELLPLLMSGKIHAGDLESLDSKAP